MRETWMLASTWDLSPLKILWLKTLLWECTIQARKSHSAKKQIQPLSNTSRSHADYYSWLLTNYRLYFKCSVVLLICCGFLFLFSCLCFFFLFSASCFYLLSLLQVLSDSFHQGRWELLCLHAAGGSEKGSESESWQRYSFVVCAHCKVCSWLLLSGKRCLWCSGPAITVCIQTTMQDQLLGEHCQVSRNFMLHYGKYL